MTNEEMNVENIENVEALEDKVDVELTEEQLGGGMEALADEDLDNVAGGAGTQVGTKLYLVNTACAGFNQALPLGRRQIASFRRGQYLCNCRLVKVIGMGDWVNYAGFGSSRKGPFQGQNGWTQASNCVLIAY